VVIGMLIFIILLMPARQVNISPVNNMFDKSGDEEKFILQVQRFPDYERHMEEYWTKRAIEHPAEVEMSRKRYESYGDLTYYPHPPIALVFAYPLVKITDDIGTLRLFSWFVFSFCILVPLYLVYKRRRRWRYLIIPTLTILLGLKIVCLASNTFYLDTFMMFFLFSSMLLWHSKYKRFSYITLALMVGCKIYAVAFLLPFLLEDRKNLKGLAYLALCSLPLVAFLTFCYAKTGDFLYPFQHWITVNQALGVQTLPKLDRALALFGFASAYFLPSLFLLGYAIYKKRIFACSLWVLGILITFSWASYLYFLLPAYFSTGLLTMEKNEKVRSDEYLQPA